MEYYYLHLLDRVPEQHQQWSVFSLSRMNTHPLLSLIFPPLALLLVLRLGLARRSVCLTPALGFAWRLGNTSESRVQMGGLDAIVGTNDDTKKANFPCHRAVTLTRKQRK